MKKKHIKKRRIVYGVLLSLPVLLSIGMIAVISITSQFPVIAPEGVMLSPVKDTKPLILSLAIFATGYMVFIGLIFKESVKKFFVKAVHQK